MTINYIGVGTPENEVRAPLNGVRVPKNELEYRGTGSENRKKGFDDIGWTLAMAVGEAHLSTIGGGVR